MFKLMLISSKKNWIVMTVLLGMSIMGIMSPFIMLDKFDERVIDSVKTEYKSEPDDTYKLVSVESNNNINVRVDNNGKYKGSILVNNEKVSKEYRISHKALLVLFTIGVFSSWTLIIIFIIKFSRVISDKLYRRKQKSGGI